MFGLIVGTLCLVALIATVRRRRYYAFREAFGRYGHRFGPRGLRLRGGRMRAPLQVLFARLDTTPGQEKAIMTALERLGGRMLDTRKELDALARELAVVVSGAVLDPGTLDGVKSRADAIYGRFSAELRDLLALVHDVLDPEQRQKFAELINDGSLFYGLCEQSGPYDDAHDRSFAHRSYRHGYGC